VKRTLIALRIMPVLQYGCNPQPKVELYQDGQKTNSDPAHLPNN